MKTKTKVIIMKDAPIRKKHPQSFQAPSQKELDVLSVNDYVKVCSNHENFWVKITAINGENITGSVGDADLLTFKKRHVYSIKWNKQK